MSKYRPNDYQRTLVRNNTVVIGSNQCENTGMWRGLIMLAAIRGKSSEIVITDPVYETATAAEADMNDIVEKLGGQIENGRRVVLA